MAQSRRIHQKALLVFVAGAAGCAGNSGRPYGVVDQYVAAIEANRPDLAYRLLDRRVRQRVSKKDFVSRWKGCQAELKQQARALRARSGARHTLKVRARAEYASGLRADLVYRDENWKIERNIIESPRSTATPEDAVKALIWAVEQRDFQAVMSVLSGPARKTVERAISRRIKQLRQGLGRGFEVTENKARLRYGRQFKLDLVREDGEWKISDFD